ncbi:hypothetical protein B0H14DRAFT_3089555 [Mycena olivaceomarginata]|nr:hypothetical protein B0H14DRAFT_3089555 [Mycena olivaceomarginata]
MSALDDAESLIRDKTQTLDPEAVYSQVLLMSVVSVATIVAFNILRPNNKSNTMSATPNDPPRIDDSICGWLPPLIHTKEPELVDKIGLDAATFLRFGRLMRWLFTGIAALSCGILIPINVAYNLKNVDSKGRNLLSMMTIRDVSGNLLFAHVVVTYLITFLIMFCVYIHWGQMLFYARTLTVLHVPKSSQSDAGIKEIFDSVRVPYPTTSVHIGRKVGKLPELIEYHNQTVRELETYLVRYLKGGKIGKKTANRTKRDAIDFTRTEKLKRTEAAIEDYRQHFHEHKPENYGFASMAAVPYAHSCVFFNTIPLFAISILANLAALTTWVPFLAHWQESSAKTFNIVSGILPPAVSGIFGFFLPIIMRSLSQYMGALTQSRLDRAVVARYFSFMVISQLFIFTLVGVIFKSVEQIIVEIGGKKSFNDIIDNLHISQPFPNTINRTYIDQSSYWLTFFPLRGFLVLFDLAQIINLVWLSFKTRVFGRTPRDIREWTQPPEFQYAIYYFPVGLVFAPLAPLVALAAAVVLWMSSIVEKYQLMFVYITKVETGGRLWNVLLMTLTIGLQYGFKSFTWISTLPPILFIAVFKIYIDRSFDSAFRYYIPTPEELDAAKIHSERADARANKLEKRFGHPALHADLFTPMLHANMMGLLSQVYQGKISREHAKLGEYGGQKMDAQVVQGIKIAAIDQRDLEFDPNLYRKNWADDWDNQSMARRPPFSGTAACLCTPQSRIIMPVNASLPRVPGYDNYLASGPNSAVGHDIELSRMDSINEPLLTPRMGYYQHQGASQASISTPPSLYQEPMMTGGREAPLHRPQGDMSPQYPPQHSSSGGPNPTPPSEPNMAGRGVFRG